MESQIYPLAIPQDEPENKLNEAFFTQTPNCIADFLEIESQLKDSLQLLRISDFRKNSYMRILMNDDDSRAVAYLETDTES